MPALQNEPRIREELKMTKPAADCLAGWILTAGGILLTVLFPLPVMVIPALLIIAAGVFLLYRHYRDVRIAKDSWLKAEPGRLQEMEQSFDQAVRCRQCLLYDEDLIARTPAGLVYLRYEDILWIYAMKRRSRFADLAFAAVNEVVCIDIDGNEYRLMRGCDDAAAALQVLRDQMRRAGYRPLEGYDDSFRRQVRKDLNLLKRRYEQSMSEQFSKAAGRWICPHCTAENENTDRCPYCGCLREINIPETPVKTKPEEEKDYSWLEPNPGSTTAKGNGMLTVFLAVACVAVMAVSLVIAHMMNKADPVPAQAAYDEAEQYYDGRLMDGYVGDKISTAFLDFTVNDARTASSYENLKPRDGYDFCIVNITIGNTITQTLPMFDTDFILFYGEGDQDACYPVTYDDPRTQSGKMLAGEYYISVGETVSGDLVYEVPQNRGQTGVLYFEEYFEGGETGDYYTVTFGLE